MHPASLKLKLVGSKNLLHLSDYKSGVIEITLCGPNSSSINNLPFILGILSNNEWK